MSVIEMQPGDYVTLKLEENYMFDGKIGVYIKTLTEKEITELTKQDRWDDLRGPIVIDVQSAKDIHFNRWRKETIPKE